MENSGYEHRLTN